LTGTGQQFQTRYKDSVWAKKASVWVQEPAKAR